MEHAFLAGNLVDRGGSGQRDMLRSRTTLMLLAVSVTASACGAAGRGDPGAVPRQRDITLAVKNQNFYDATLYAIGPGGSPGCL